MIIGLLLFWTIGVPLIVLAATAIAARRREAAGPRKWAPPSPDAAGSETGGRPLEPSAAEHVGNRPQQDLEIEPKRPVGAVEVVDLHHLGHGNPR